VALTTNTLFKMNPKTLLKKHLTHLCRNVLKTLAHFSGVGAALLHINFFLSGGWLPRVEATRFVWRPPWGLLICLVADLLNEASSSSLGN
jgi:hypothetical protein